MNGYAGRKAEAEADVEAEADAEDRAEAEAEAYSTFDAEPLLWLKELSNGVYGFYQPQHIVTPA